MMKRWLVLLAMTLFILTGCSGTEEDIESGFEDRRIISLMPSNTEILVELGLEGNLVGVTSEDNYPESVANDASLTKFNTFELDAEKMIALEPTHILGYESSAPYYEDTLKRVSESTGAEVLIVDEAKSISGIYDSIKAIGEFVNEKTAAEWLKEDIERKVNVQNSVFENRDEEARVFIHISSDPELYTAGAETFIDDALSEIHVENAFDDIDGYAAISPEAVIERNPTEVVSIMGLDDEELEEALSGIPGIEGHELDDPKKQCNIEPDLLARPGPRIADGLRAVGRCIYE
ncbi:ABC transporter substrate-binding protein [Salinicoccus jeotgali]|uniref:ABC transporter substrate-binding protein n=1 Tax=Salinicoccus jeotgali TaxID=381634 RepID=A0ABP7F790_9STAP